MMHADVQAALNALVNSQFAMEYQTLAGAAYTDAQAMTGCTSWLKAKAEKQHQYGRRLFEFLLSRSGAAKLAVIAAPKDDFKSVLEVFTTGLTREEAITAQISALYEQCFQFKAFAEMAELHWFMIAQAAEEKTAREIVVQFTLVAADPGAVLALDRELAEAT